MNGTTHLKEPRSCTADECQEFARLVRLGFEGSDGGLDGRIGAAKWLAFHYVAEETLGAIAALKVPTTQYRDAVFANADTPVRPADYGLELGWVFVVPTHRRNRIAARLCRALLARAPMSGVFATTSPGNTPMIGILHALGFARAGKPFPHPRRKQELVMFLRAPRAFGTAGPASQRARGPGERRRIEDEATG